MMRLVTHLGVIEVLLASLGSDLTRTKTEFWLHNSCGQLGQRGGAKFALAVRKDAHVGFSAVESLGACWR